MLNKQIPTTIGILIVVLLVGVVGAIILLLSQEDEEKGLLEEGVEYEKEEMTDINKEVDDSGVDQNEKIEDWKTYRNEDYGFKISYPKNLKEEESDGYGTGFSLEAEGDALLRVYVGIDQVGYDGRISVLKRDDIIEGTTAPFLKEVVIEEGVVDGAKESFKASYVRNTYNAVNDIMEREEIVELYALGSHTYIMSCRKDMNKCKEIFSTFRLL